MVVGKIPEICVRDVSPEVLTRGLNGSAAVADILEIDDAPIHV